MYVSGCVFCLFTHTWQSWLTYSTCYMYHAEIHWSFQWNIYCDLRTSRKIQLAAVRFSMMILLSTRHPFRLVCAMRKTMQALGSSLRFLRMNSSKLIKDEYFLQKIVHSCSLRLREKPRFTQRQKHFQLTSASDQRDPTVSDG